MKHPNKVLKEFKRLHLFYEQGAVFTAFDTETTSISPSTGRVMEIGAVKFNKDGVIAKWHHLFNPQTIIPPFISELTHITQEMVDQEDTIDLHIASFKEFIGETVLIGHNVQFDLNFINAECQKCNLTVTTNRAIDTLQFSQWAFPNTKSHKLEYLADYLKINKGNSHRALDDAITCKELFLECIKQRKS